MKFVEYTWGELDRDLEVLADVIKHDIPNSPQYIYGIPRGGTVIAVILSHKLRLEYKNILGSEYTTIVVDDITDTGKTLEYYIQFKYKTYTIHWKSPARKPTAFIREVNDNEWIVYPWEDKTKAKQDYEYYVKRRKL